MKDKLIKEAISLLEKVTGKKIVLQENTNIQELSNYIEGYDYKIEGTDAHVWVGLNISNGEVFKFLPSLKKYLGKINQDPNETLFVAFTINYDSYLHHEEQQETVTDPGFPEEHLFEEFSISDIEIGEAIKVDDQKLAEELSPIEELYGIHDEVVKDYIKRR